MSAGSLVDGMFTSNDTFEYKSDNLKPDTLYKCVLSINGMTISEASARTLKEPEVLIVFVAAIQTNRSDNMFEPLKKNLIENYKQIKKKAVFLEQDTVFPIGERKDFSMVDQISHVGEHLENGTGGIEIDKEVINYVKKYGRPDEIVLIGHSGGGQAVGDALYDLDALMVNIDHVIQVGAPPQGIYKPLADKCTRIQTSKDLVANYVPGIGNGQLDGIVGSGIHWLDQYATRTLNKPIIVDDINIYDGFLGGHTCYFDKEHPTTTGKYNNDIITEKIWEILK